MRTLLVSLLAPFCSCLRSRAAMHTEMLALRHQLAVLQRSNRRRPRLRVADRILWLGLSRFWAGWRTALVIVKPETVVAWHRQGFRLYMELEKSPRRPGQASRP